MAEQNILAQIDTAIGDFIGSWNTTSTIITLLAVIIFLGPLFLGEEPDIHPFLLARQSQATPIRQQGESAVYRSNDLGYGHPLRTGLGVKDPGAPKWTSGRDGDIRDVWRKAVNGPKKEDGSSAGPRGKIQTMLGTQKIVEHDLDSLTAEINTIGKHVQDAGGKKVVVHLSNSIELLSTVLAGAFYQFSVVLVPYGQTPRDSVHLISQVHDADTLIAEAGSVALDDILTKKSNIKCIIWVAKAGSMHLDWDEVPEGVGGKIDVSTWHELVEEKKSSTSREVPPVDRSTTPPSISAFWPTTGGKHELVEYSSQNITSATAALIASFPASRRLTPADTLLPAAPFTDTYTLTWTFAALFSNANLLLNSVAGESIDITVSTRNVKPTVIIATSESILKLHDRIIQNGLGSFISTYFAKKNLANGVMSQKKLGPTTSTALPNLKTLLIAQRDTAPSSARLSSSVLATIRLAAGARTAYALTTAKVAGAVCQTNILDYRDKGKNTVCLGGPVSSVEIHLAGEEDEMQKTDAKGKVVVKGPAVVSTESFGGKKNCTMLESVQASVDVDHTLLLI